MTRDNPGTAAHYLTTGSSRDGHAHGGHDLSPAPFVHKRIQVRQTDHPSTDRWVSLTTTRTLCPAPTYRYEVGVVDGHGRNTQPPRTFPTLRRARNAANALLRAQETD